jgi:hemoglobin-like flavoprotein
VNHQALIAGTLERIGDMDINPTADVYRRLFAKHPELETLFVLDRDGAVRGNMLAKALEALIDLAGPRAFGPHFIRAEATNHDGIGVSGEIYAAFFDCILDAVRDALADAWSDELEVAWGAVIAEARAISI